MECPSASRFVRVVASQLSNLPAIEVDAFTLNLIVLFTGVISTTADCARLSEGNAAGANRQRMANRTRIV
jgi:hypothetical protein